MSNRPSLRESRKMRITRHSPRVAEMNLTNPHTRYVPAIRHNHRVWGR